MAILTIDQEKAVDRIDHRYLFKVLRTLDFPDIFIDYNSVDSVIKVNSILCGPIQLLCDIRQCCSFSGQLYALCIEPLLYYIRKCTAFSGLNIPTDGVFKLSAYADDVTLLMCKYTDLIALHEIINMYESASNSRKDIILILSVLCASNLWHVFRVLQPPKIWRIVCRRVLYGKETIGPKGIFYHCLMNMEPGGLGFMHFVSQIQYFRYKMYM